MSAGKPRGNKRYDDVCEVMNGDQVCFEHGKPMAGIPKELPPRITLFEYLEL